jgi:hypothetical protein
MALVKKVKPGKLNINLEEMTVSIALCTIIEEDGVEISRQTHRCGFCPGDIEKVKEYLGVPDCPELQYLDKIWTPEVIADYKAKVDLINK